MMEQPHRGMLGKSTLVSVSRAITMSRVTGISSVCVVESPLCDWL